MGRCNCRRASDNRNELKRLLECVESAGDERPRVVLSGDIHTQHLARWRSGDSARCVHQVTSSPFSNKPLGKFPVAVTYGNPPFDRDFPLHGKLRGRIDWFCNKRGFAQVRIQPQGKTAGLTDVRYWIEERRSEALVPKPWSTLDGAW